MSATYVGKLDWSASLDENLQKTYTLVGLVETDNKDDGPYTVMSAVGMPLIGSYWAFGNDIDPWAYCRPEMTIRPIHQKGDPHYYWEVEQKFSTIPFERCCDQQVQNPLQEPMKVSGSFVKYTKKTSKDSDGLMIRNSSFEAMKVERDRNRPQVNISQNVANLQLDKISQFVDCLNDASLWGLSKRMIKLSDVSWERKIYGKCNYYYTRNFTFDINFETFDLYDVLDAGLMRLKGAYNAAGVWATAGGVDRSKPDDFIRIKDLHGELLPIQALDKGERHLTPQTNPRYLPYDIAGNTYPGTGIKLYSEVNFLTLGIPTSL